MKQHYPIAVFIVALWLMVLPSCSKDSEADHAPGIRPVTPASSKYVTQLLAYQPAPGQFVNTSIGDSTGALTVLKGKTGLVSLGAWGGYIVFAFDHTVLNKDDTADIMIYSNTSPGFSEPGIVSVMFDDNANGKADDVWYQLRGSGHELPGYKRDYAITYSRPDSAQGDVPWKGSDGLTGTVARNVFHEQSYYPAWILADEYTLHGSLLPPINIDPGNPAHVTSAPFAFGYADNIPGGDMLDLANAIDSTGAAVVLRGADFIRIQTGIIYNMGAVGEQSTEIAGVADISMGLD